MAEPPPPLAKVPSTPPPLAKLSEAPSAPNIDVKGFLDHFKMIWMKKDIYKPFWVFHCMKMVLYIGKNQNG